MNENLTQLEIIDFIDSKPYEGELLAANLRSEIDGLTLSLSQDILVSKQNNKLRLNYILSTKIAELFKQYFLLLRNLLYEKINAHVKYASNLISDEEFEKFKTDQLSEHAKYKGEFGKEISEILSFSKDSKLLNKLDLELTLVDDPFAIYKEDYDGIKGQIRLLLNFESQIDRLVLKFKNLNDSISNQLEKYLNVAHNIEKDRLDILGFINKSNPDSQKLKAVLASFEKNCAALKEPDSLIEIPDKHIGALKNVETIVGYKNGNVFVKNINVVRQFKNWMSTIILPDFQKIIGLFYVESMRHYRYLNGQSAHLLNPESRSNMEMDSIDHLNYSKEDHIFSDYFERIEALKVKVKEKLNVYSLQHNEIWDENLISDTYSRVKESTEPWLEFLKNKYKSTKELFDRQFGGSEVSYSSNNQIIVNIIKDQIPESVDHYYPKIFLDQFNLLDFFNVRREFEISQFRESIEWWRKGFGNSLLIYGIQYCGKTSFLQIAKKVRDFEQTIYLRPNITLTMDGRKFNTGNELQIALDLIKKNVSSHKNYCIVIDDLEEWRSPKANLFQNAQELMGHIDRSKLNLFFIVSTTLKCVERLNSILDFSSLFTNEIDLSNMDGDAFVETVLNRHETCQREISHQNGRVLVKDELIAMARNILKVNNGNVGSALVHWVGNIGQDLIIKKYKTKKRKIPNLMENQDLYLINLLLTFRKLEQNELLNHFPMTQRNEIRNHIGRLLKLKILFRDSENNLRVTPILINELYAQNDFIEKDMVKLNYYVIRSIDQIEGDISEVVNRIMYRMFCFPFMDQDSKVSYEIINKRLEIAIKSHEVPAIIIKYINVVQDELRFEFKTKIK